MNFMLFFKASSTQSWKPYCHTVVTPILKYLDASIMIRTLTFIMVLIIYATLVAHLTPFTSHNFVLWYDHTSYIIHTRGSWCAGCIIKKNEILFLGHLSLSTYKFNSWSAMNHRISSKLCITIGTNPITIIALIIITHIHMFMKIVILSTTTTTTTTIAVVFTISATVTISTSISITIIAVTIVITCT